MGKDNGNTTNSWLNLAKILELTLNNGVSTVSGKEIKVTAMNNDIDDRLGSIRELFYKNAEYCSDLMVEAANKASKAISLQPVPFLSVLMGGIQSGYDMRDTEHQGTKYNGSGCLIHGLCVVADSFIAIDSLLRERPQDSARLIKALQTNFADDEELRQYLLSCPKYGNNIHLVDEETEKIASQDRRYDRFQKNLFGQFI